MVEHGLKDKFVINVLDQGEGRILISITPNNSDQNFHNLLFRNVEITPREIKLAIENATGLSDLVNKDVGEIVRDARTVACNNS